MNVALFDEESFVVASSAETATEKSRSITKNNDSDFIYSPFIIARPLLPFMDGLVITG
jgi:hypothetical protein